MARGWPLVGPFPAPPPRHTLAAMTTDQGAALEFECADCDLLVFSVGPRHNPDRRCAGCQFVADARPADREELRAELARREVIGTPRPRAAVEAYADPAYPPRPCDHCGRSYQGPAVYCSISCALADA